MWSTVHLEGLKFMHHFQGSPQKKKSSGRSHKNLNLVREQRNNMFTVARAKKSKDVFIMTQQSIVVSRPITHSPAR